METPNVSRPGDSHPNTVEEGWEWIVYEPVVGCICPNCADTTAFAGVKPGSAQCPRARAEAAKARRIAEEAGHIDDD